MTLPPLELNQSFQPGCQAQRELLRFDLDKKVYPEIQARMEETYQWLFRKFTLAGGLLGGFLIHVWLSLRDKENRSHETVENVLSRFLKDSATCAVLGLALIVSLLIDLHVRMSFIAIQRLGLWAATADVALGGTTTTNAVPGWEQFIRPGGGSFRQNFVETIHTGDMSTFTLILFAAYYWAFQEVCLRRLDRLNLLISWFLILMLIMLFIGCHMMSGNVTFDDSSPLFNWRCYLAACFLLSTSIALWGFSSPGRPPEYDYDI